MRNSIVPPIKETSHPRSGDALRVRPLAAEDGEKLRGMFSRLSEKTIYRRFLMPYPRVPDWMAAHLSKVDRPHEQSLVVVAEGEIVGHAMYVRENGDEAEFAVVVEDEWQSRGVGKLLFFRLALEARHRGVEVFTATILGENRRMLDLLDVVFSTLEYEMKGGVYHVRVPLSSLKPMSKLEVLDAPGGGSTEEVRRNGIAPYREIESLAC